MKNSQHKITHKMEHNHDILSELLGIDISSQNIYYKNDQIINIRDYEYEEYISKEIKLNGDNILLDCECKFEQLCECGLKHTLKCTNCVIKTKLNNNSIKNEDIDSYNSNEDFM